MCIGSAYNGRALEHKPCLYGLFPVQHTFFTPYGGKDRYHFMDQRILRQAQVLVGYCLGVKPGNLVAIYHTEGGIPLMRAVYGEVYRAGGVPTSRFLPEIDDVMYDLASDQALQTPSPFDLIANDTFHHFVQIDAAANANANAGVDPLRRQARSRAYAETNKRFGERWAARELTWVATEHPVNSAAQAAGMSLRAYEDFLYGVMGVDRKDPVSVWRRIRRQNAKLIRAMRGGRQVHLVGPGTDLTMVIEGRTFENDDGKLNFPGGEVWTSPVEDSVNGMFASSPEVPIDVNGRPIKAVVLRIENGRIVDASAQVGEELLISMLDTDEGARGIGELGIGTNMAVTRATGNTMLDEKIGGTVHVAFGHGFEDCGGQEGSSVVHQDMVCDLRNGGALTVDGKPILVNGEFVF